MQPKPILLSHGEVAALKVTCAELAKQARRMANGDALDQQGVDLMVRVWIEPKRRAMLDLLSGVLTAYYDGNAGARIDRVNR